jgi:hypothetical protein
LAPFLTGPEWSFTFSQEFQVETGTDFDPAVVKAFESAFRRQKMEVPEVMV